MIDKLVYCLVVGFALNPGTVLAQGEMRISLKDALKAAVEHNLDIQLQRVSVDVRNISFQLTRAGYEPTITSSYTTAGGEEEPQNATQGFDSFSNKFQNFNFSLEKRTDFGMTLGLTFDNNRSERTSRDSLGEAYGSTISVRMEQDLLKGFGFDHDISRKDEYIAKHDLNISAHDLEIQIINILEQAENGYWDLVSAIEQLKVSQESLALAQDLYNENKQKIEVGTLAPIELKNTEADVASRERDIVQAENRVRQAEDSLKKIMNLEENDWFKTLMPSDQLVIGNFDLDPKLDYQRALKNRAEMKKNRIEKEKANLNEKYQKNQQLPGLNLTVSYRSNGQDIPQVIFDPETQEPIGVIDPSYQNAFEEALNNEVPSFNVNLALSWTPWNRKAKLDLAQARVDLRQNELATQQTKLNILEEVRAGIRGLEFSLKSVRANEKTVRFREENLKAEEQKFQNGLSTNYRVSQVQEELSRARSDLIQSKTDYRKAAVTYYKALGLLARERQITVR